MQTVGLPIPAALFNSLYTHLGESIFERVNEHLTELLPPEDATAPKLLRSVTYSQYPRPRIGTITGRVWEIADELHKKSTVTREEVVTRCTAEGINPNTANTQFSYWKKANA